MALLLQGDPEGALTAMREEPEGWRVIGMPMVLYALGRRAESDAALADLIRTQAENSAFNIAYVLAFRDEADRAFAWLDKAVAHHDPGLSEIAYTAQFANIRGDPRWDPFLRKIGKAPEQLAAIEFDVKLPK
jgi:hypothetical protein